MKTSSQVHAPGDAFSWQQGLGTETGQILNWVLYLIASEKLSKSVISLNLSFLNCRKEMAWEFALGKVNDSLHYSAKSSPDTGSKLHLFFCD